MNRLARLLRHLFAPSARHMFPADRLQRITKAIAAGELSHTGEVCFAIEAALPATAVLVGQQARDRAVEIFGHLRVWDTEANNGVLLYVLLADHRIEIVADRASAVGSSPANGPPCVGRWNNSCARTTPRWRWSRVSKHCRGCWRSISPATPKIRATTSCRIRPTFSDYPLGR